MRRLWVGAAVACMIVGASNVVHGQAAGWRRCMVGVGYGAPFKLAVSYSSGLVRESSDGGADVCTYISGKVGIGGARLALGASRTIFALGGAAGASVGVLRTFGSPWHAQPWRNHVGVAMHLLPALGLGAEVGYYVRVGNDANGAPAKRLITWSTGFGF